MKIGELHIRWVGILIVSALAMINDGEGHMSDKPIWFHYFVSLCFTAVYWNGACSIIFFLRKKFPEIDRTKRRVLLSAAFIIVWMTVGGIP
ncbi:MAG: hypothetical protein ABJQ84_15620, partial [Ekhidna sp.]